MYGIINKALEELVSINFGPDKWKAIKEKSNIPFDFFISTEPYDDEITLKLIQSVSEEMNLSVEEVLFLFGRWWVVITTKERYGDLMRSGGNTLREFLINLPSFHNRILLLYPKLTPPEFRVSHLAENSLHLHYISKRQGLSSFVLGLIEGLGVIYETELSVDLIKSRDSGDPHEIYKITWANE